MTTRKARHAGLVSGIQGTAAAVAIAIGSNPAIAQTDDVTSDDQDIEEIVVTGSRLVRRDFSAPSPIQTIDREAIAFSGQATLETALNKMPQVMPGFDRTSNNPGTGTASVNLRGLGSNRTLVMFNGRRLAPAGIGSSVDINSLPQSLIERVEVITGGATTVYGSDAVSGVVNFITRTDLDGFSLDASTYITEEGDATTHDVNVTWGHEFSNGNITVFGGYYDREPLFQADREFTQFAWFDGNGEIVAGGSSATTAGTLLAPRIDFGDGQGPIRGIFEPDGNLRPFVRPDDFYNYAPVNYLQIPMERYMGGVLANYDLTDRFEAYIELAHTRIDIRRNLAPVPVFAPLEVNLDNPVLTPSTQTLFANNLFPAGPNSVVGIFGRRMVEAGARIGDEENEYSRAVAGIRGEIFTDWDFDAWVIYNKSDENKRLLNGIMFSRLQQGLLVDPVTGQCFDPSNGCVPVDIFGEGRMSEAAAEFIRAPGLENPISRTQKSFAAFVRGEPFSTWAGAIQTAIGVEWRSDEGSFKADDLIFAGDILGYNGDAPVNGKETVAEVYLEAIVPLAENTAWAEYLALELGGRYSGYDHAGGVEAYKVGVEWIPATSWRFRTMHQRSVRAPNLVEAFQERFVNGVFPFVVNNPAEDPCSAAADPIGTGHSERCVIQGIPANEVGVWEATVGVPTIFRAGGNPDLTPEVATTFTAGVVFAPESVPDLQISADYFDLEIEDTIGFLFVDVACFDVRNTAFRFCDKVIRDPVTYDIIELDEQMVNKGVLSTRGVDVQLNWSTDLPDVLAISDQGADLVIDVMYTHMLENIFQQLSFGTAYDCAGRFGWPCSSGPSTTYPTNRATTNFNYGSGNTGIYMTWRWIEGTRNAENIGDDIFGRPPSVNLIEHIGSKHYLDLGFSQRFGDHVNARLTISNLLDTSPAFMADAGFNNTDPGMYDLFGRSYTLAFSLEY